MGYFKMNNKLPKIYIGGDHASYYEREKLQKHLYELGYDVYSVGSNNALPANYAVFALKVANRVQENPGSLGIVICGSGIGVNIAANKVRGVKSALVYTELFAKLARNKNYNVIALGSRFIPYKKLQKIVETYLNADTTVKSEIADKEYYDIDLSNKVDADDIHVSLNPINETVENSNQIDDIHSDNLIDQVSLMEDKQEKSVVEQEEKVEDKQSLIENLNESAVEVEKPAPKKRGRPKKSETSTSESKPKTTRKTTKKTKTE